MPTRQVIINLYADARPHTHTHTQRVTLTQTPNTKRVLNANELVIMLRWLFRHLCKESMELITFQTRRGFRLIHSLFYANRIAVAPLKCTRFLVVLCLHIVQTSFSLSSRARARKSIQSTLFTELRARRALRPLNRSRSGMRTRFIHSYMYIYVCISRCGVAMVDDNRHPLCSSLSYYIW